ENKVVRAVTYGFDRLSAVRDDVERVPKAAEYLARNFLVDRVVFGQQNPSAVVTCARHGELAGRSVRTYRGRTRVGLAVLIQMNQNIEQLGRNDRLVDDTRQSARFEIRDAAGFAERQ